MGSRSRAFSRNTPSIGSLVVGGGPCIDGSGVLLLVFRRWIRGVVRMASGDVGSADVVGVTPTLEFGVAFTLEFDAGSTLEGGTSSSRSGVHLFRLGVWCSERTPVSRLRNKSTLAPTQK